MNIYNEITGERVYNDTSINYEDPDDFFLADFKELFEDFEELKTLIIIRPTHDARGNEIIELEIPPTKMEFKDGSYKIDVMHLAYVLGSRRFLDDLPFTP